MTSAQPEPVDHARLFEHGSLFADDDAPSSLLDVLDRVLDQGVVLSGDLTITVADVPLLYVGLDLVLCSPDQIPPDLRRWNGT